ncbi:MAG: sulfatase [Verrucomicrobiota bacterium]
MKHQTVTRLPLICISIILFTSAPMFTLRSLGEDGRETLSTESPNVILLLADDMGMNGPAVYGSDLHETPNIDRLAAEGVRFTNGYAACTVCSPTRAAAMTGMYPARTRVTNWITGTKMPYAQLSPPDWTLQLEHHHTTIAEALKAAGYQTAHVGKWHLGDEPFYPEHQGFDVNIGGNSQGSPSGGYHLPNKIDLPRAKEGEYLTDHLTLLATEWITETQKTGDPFFMYFAYYNVHTPIQGRADYTEHYQKKIDARDPKGPEPIHTNAEFAAMHHSVDDSVGQILDTLDKLGIKDNTLVIFTSDNGGLSHKIDNTGVLNPTGITSNFPLRRGKGSAYEGGHRVPFIIAWPGHIPSGVVSDTPIGTVDLYPTILDITGVAGNADHNAKVDGAALTSHLKDPASPLPARDLHWHFPHYHAGVNGPYSAIRRGDWKLIERHETPDEPELYNLKDDVSEQTNLAATNPEKTSELQKALHDWRTSIDAQMPSPNPNHNPNSPRTNAKTKAKQTSYSKL